MLVQYQMIMKKEDVTAAIESEVRDLMEDLEQSKDLLEGFISRLQRTEVVSACDFLKTFHEEIRELEIITANIRKNYEGFVRASLPQPEEATVAEAPSMEEEGQPSETNDVNKLMEAINTLKQLKATI